MRRFLCAAGFLLPVSAFLFGCEGDGGQSASSTARPADVAAPTTLMHDHQPPRRTPEN